MPKGIKGFQKNHKSFLTFETKKKISEALKKIGHKPPSPKGKHRTEETRRKMSNAKIGYKNPMFGKHYTEEDKKIMSSKRKGKSSWWLLGKKRPEITGDKNPMKRYDVRQKVSKANTGRKHSEEHKKKISKSLKGKWVGDKHYNWQGGISSLPYPQNWTDDLKESIRKRDNYICQICEIHQNELTERFIKKLSVHHIDYRKGNLDPNNLITLCTECHMKTNFNRSYWTNYFNPQKEIY